MSRILLVDDDGDQLEIRKLLLERSGHVVDAVRSPASAETLAPSLVITDLRLPGIEDGLALIRALHARRPAPRIIVLTGWAGDFSRYPEARMVDQFVRKPARSGHLLELVAQLAIS